MSFFTFIRRPRSTDKKRKAPRHAYTLELRLHDIFSSDNTHTYPQILWIFYKTLINQIVNLIFHSVSSQAKNFLSLL